MAQQWEEIKNKVGDIASQAATKAVELTKDAAVKAEELGKLGKIKLDLYQLKKDQDKQFTKIGNIVYTLLKEGKFDDLLKENDVSDIMKKIEEIATELDAKEEKYQNIKTEHSSKNEDNSDVHEEEEINNSEKE